MLTIGKHQYQIDIHHYLATLKKKPGAIAHSLALKQAIPWLQETFQNYYSTNPKDFIHLLTIIKENSLEQVRFAIKDLRTQRLPIQNDQIIHYLLNKNSIIEPKNNPMEPPIEETCQSQLSEISKIYSQGDSSWIN